MLALTYINKLLMKKISSGHWYPALNKTCSLWSRISLTSINPRMVSSFEFSENPWYKTLWIWWNCWIMLLRLLYSSALSIVIRGNILSQVKVSRIKWPPDVYCFYFSDHHPGSLQSGAVKEVGLVLPPPHSSSSTRPRISSMALLVNMISSPSSVINWFIVYIIRWELTRM